MQLRNTQQYHATDQHCRLIWLGHTYMFIGSGGSHYLESRKKGVWSSVVIGKLYLTWHMCTSVCLCKYWCMWGLNLKSVSLELAVCTWCGREMAVSTSAWLSIILKQAENVNKPREMLLNWPIWLSFIEVWEWSPVRKDLSRGHNQEREILLILARGRIQESAKVGAMVNLRAKIFNHAH